MSGVGSKVLDGNFFFGCRLPIILAGRSGELLVAPPGIVGLIIKFGHFPFYRLGAR
jgi:hypothetical protein